MNRREVCLGVLATGVSEITAAHPQKLPDYIKINMRHWQNFESLDMELKIHNMVEDACIQFSYNMLEDIEHLYKISFDQLIDEIEFQHPELNITMIDDDGINEEIRIWLEVKPGIHFETFPFDPGPYASDQRKDLTIKLPSENDESTRAY